MSKRVMKRKTKIIIIVSILSTLLVALLPPIIEGIKTSVLNNSYKYLAEMEEYKEKQFVDEVKLVKQEISCGYATIEMLSSYYGEKITEEELSSKNDGAITTSTTSGFLKEVNKSISTKEFCVKKNLKNDVFLKYTYESLKNNNPVAFEWAAKHENEWTLHFSIITSLDIRNNEVNVNNPYGYIETLTIDDLLYRTSMRAFGAMNFFMSYPFTFGLFDKNTIFTVK